MKTGNNGAAYRQSAVIAPNITEYKSDEGSVIGISAIAQDITERKRIEEALQQSESRFRLLAEAIPQIVWTTGSDGLPHYFNQRWRDYTGLTVEEQSHANERVLVLHPDDIPRCQLLWQEAIATGKSYEVEYRLRSGQDGSYRWFLVRALPIHDSKGNIVEWFGTCTDIDDQKRVEEELRENERRKDDFISMVSHELKTPITSIKAMNQFLQRTLKKKAMDEPVSYLERMDGQLNRLNKLISDLLDMTRISAGSVELVNESFEFDDWLEVIIADLQQVSSHTITCTGSIGREIVGDRDRLGQVVTNLITNAIKYSPEATAIEVGIVMDDGSVIVNVRDRGIGIPQALQERIFERFFRVGTNKQVPGLGIGLYIASEIVRLHGGKIWVESVEGEGSTFSFSLPLV